MNFDNIGTVATTMGGGFLAGILIGYGIKKIVKLAAVVVGLFVAGLAYLQYQQIVAINWNKIPRLSQNLVTSLANATTQIPGFNNGDHTAASSTLGIPLTSSMSIGFAIGFLKA